MMTEMHILKPFVKGLGYLYDAAKKAGASEDDIACALKAEVELIQSRIARKKAESVELELVAAKAEIRELELKLAAPRRELAA